jgi:hypothetical protein
MFMLENWPPSYVLGLASIVCGALCMIVFILSIFLYNYRALGHSTALQRERQNADLALKRELIQRGLPPQDLEQAIKVLQLDRSTTSPASEADSADPDEQIEAAILARFAWFQELSPRDIEEAGTLVRAADRRRKEAVLYILNQQDPANTPAADMLAAIRSLCRPTERSREAMDLNPHVMSRG